MEMKLLLKDYFTVESRFDSSKANYGDTILADITDTVVNESNKFHGGRID
jgi:hypothetical protein